MAAAAAGARRVRMRAPGVCNRPNRRVPGSCKERGRNILQVNATIFTFSIALSGHGPFMSISNFADVAFNNAYLAPPLCAEIEGILRRRLTKLQPGRVASVDVSYCNSRFWRSYFHPAKSTRAFITSSMRSLKTGMVKPNLSEERLR